MARICIITPIVSEGFRDNGPLMAAVSATDAVEQKFLKYGPASVESAVDEVLAGPGVIDAALAAEAEGYEALVIDCMLDPALEAARESVSIPVIGCGEAGFRAAAKLGRFSVITVLQRQERAFRELAARHGLSDSLASVRGVGISVLELEQDRQASIAASTSAAIKAANEDGAETIIFGCTGMLGFAAPVARALGWEPERVIDPLPNAVSAAHAAAANHYDKSAFPAPESKEIRGFGQWHALSSMFAVKS